ncbi:MAG: YlxR family protein [Solirubrobacteraceae bacterium]
MGPQRRCVGCGQSAPKRELLRLAVAAERPGLAVADEAARIPGRGAYIHRRAACLADAARRGGAARTLRGNVKIDPEIVELAV